MRAGEVLIGHFVISASPAMVELVGYTGADFVGIDCEHSPISPYGHELDACVRAAYAAGVAPIVRIAAQDAAQVRRAAEAGAKGVMVPHVNTPQELELMLRALRLPPDGDRGCAPSVRATRYGCTPWGEFAAESAATVEVIPIFEEPRAFDRLDEILDVEGLGVVGFGGFDMVQRVGRGGGDAAAVVYGYLERLVEACAARDVVVIDSVSSLEDFVRRVELGCRGIMYSTDMGILRVALQEQVGRLRDHLAGL